MGYLATIELLNDANSFEILVCTTKTILSAVWYRNLLKEFVYVHQNHIARVLLSIPSYIVVVISNKKAMERHYSEGGRAEDKHYLLLLHDKRGALRVIVCAILL